MNGDLTFTNNIVDCGSDIFVTSTGEDLSEYFEINGNVSNTDHGMVWYENEVYMNNHSNWASWTLAATSGWVKMSAANVSITEVDEIINTIYPNPIVNNSVSVSFKTQQKGICFINNSLGQLLQRIPFDSNNLEINNLTERGSYFVKIELNSGQVINKVLIK